MSGGIAAVQRDTDPLIYGTHSGGTGLYIIQSDKQFKTFGAYAGLAVRNTTDSTSGHVVSVAEGSVLTDITFHNGDTYEIYCTATYNGKISTIYTDRLAGHKVSNQDDLIDGRLPEDVDLEDEEWSTGFPYQTKT
jgi:hypothetical protein